MVLYVQNDLTPYLCVGEIMNLLDSIIEASVTKGHPKNQQKSAIAVIVRDEETGKEQYFTSYNEASRELDVYITSIQRALFTGSRFKGKYRVRYPDKDFVKQVPYTGPVIQIETGKVFKNMSQAAKEANVPTIRIKDALVFGYRIKGYTYRRENT